ncbi:hypothetical protein C0993_000816, partial [Termitomyces sp. T159_Od127]
GHDCSPCGARSAEPGAVLAGRRQGVHGQHAAAGAAMEAASPAARKAPAGGAKGLASPAKKGSPTKPSSKRRGHPAPRYE